MSPGCRGSCLPSDHDITLYRLFGNDLESMVLQLSIQSGQAYRMREGLGEKVEQCWLSMNASIGDSGGVDGTGALVKVRVGLVGESGGYKESVFKKVSIGLDLGSAGGFSFSGEAGRVGGGEI